MIACVSELHTYWTFIWPILLYLFSCAYLQKAYRSITIAQRKQAEFVVALTLCACTIDIPSRCWHYVNFLPKQLFSVTTVLQAYEYLCRWYQIGPETMKKPSRHFRKETERWQKGRNRLTSTRPHFQQMFLKDIIEPRQYEKFSFLFWGWNKV